MFVSMSLEKYFQGISAGILPPNVDQSRAQNLRLDIVVNRGSRETHNGLSRFMYIPVLQEAVPSRQEVSNVNEGASAEATFNELVRHYANHV